MIKRAIITGATGAIGTALVNELVNNNTEVLVLCRQDSDRRDNIPTHPLVECMQCDMSDFVSFENNTGKEYDVFYHLAWMGTTGEARNDMFLQNLNVQYALDAVKLAKRFGCKTFIGAGSQAEYGKHEGALKPETSVKPNTGYGMAKLCAGFMTHQLAMQEGINHIWVRILSVYGPFDTPESMIMSTINKLRENTVPNLTKGEQIWDYLHSYDAARALRLIALEGISGKTYVLGSGTARPLKDYVKIIQSAVNPECEIRLGAIPYAKNQIMHLEADIEELKKDTGFYPEIKFEDGILSLL